MARISEKKESKMIKMELKNLTKSYEKGKIALDHFSALEPEAAYLDQMGLENRP